MSVSVDVVLPASLTSVSEARRLVGEALADVGAGALWDRAGLATSELVTNAVVHAGSAPRLRVEAFPNGIRVEVYDGSAHMPSRRNYATGAGTGRGLLLVEHSADRWDAVRTEKGKVVWFEVGTVPREERPALPASASAVPSVSVRLLEVPLLMHWAWQEHAQSLLREYLLFAFAGDAGVLRRHAEASEALAVLYEQIPLPALPDDPEALLADTLEPGVTAAELIIQVPEASLPHFASLQSILSVAVQASVAGHLLGPPTQPEIVEMRDWLCEEITRQAHSACEPRPWRARTDVRSPIQEGERLHARYAELAGGDSHVLVTDEASVIVAVSSSVTTFLGYSSASDLLGRRIIVVIPHRYHQAHVAGATLNATNGRDVLLGVSLTVPMVRADGTEVDVGLCVTPRRLGADRVFVAQLELPAAAP